MTLPRTPAHLAGPLLVLAALMPLLAVAPNDAFAQSASASAVAAAHARVIVKYKAGGALMRESALAARDPDRVAVQVAGRLSQRLGLTLRDGFAIAPRTQVLFARDLSSAELVARLQADPDVEYAEVDERMHITAVPNDPRYADNQPVITPAAGQWYLRPPTGALVSAIDAQTAWNTTKGSPAIVVAVLDTGVRADHPDLAGKLLPGYDFVSADDDGSFTSANDGNGRDADPSDPGDWVTSAESQQSGGPLQGCQTQDSSWHGTQTAALIGAATDNGTGMASVGWNVRIVPVRVLGKCGGFQSDVIAGMYWAAGINIPSAFGTGPTTNPYPAKVLNMSLGSATTTCSNSYQDAVNAVNAAGASVVVSAGNDAGLAVGQPANCAGAIGVGGLRHIGTKVGFSDVGPQIGISAPGGNCVTLTGTCQYPILTATNAGVMTPAGNTYTDGGANFSVGTSFSAPLVSGTLGLMLSVNSNLEPAQLRVGVMRTSRAFPAAGAAPGIPVCHAPDSNAQDECYCTTATCGAGMLDVANAVGAANALRAWITPEATQVFPGGSVPLDGAKSWAVEPSTISSYEWSITSGQSLATLQGTDGPTTTLNTTGAGTVVVQLTVSDSATPPAKATDQVTITVGSSTVPPSGGGSLSWPWLLALAAAAAALRPRRP